ncbi:hypothetical protein LOD99_6859 [Oopsacas minuta]|uniref:OTU domain-containing protein n=1 Tax=Oopsacas minuta TaxID=111878 RepID=A0AAV7JJ92_9METZ|nr:hypothetical protein LOD99_6859 [Oopsacas minuta]
MANGLVEAHNKILKTKLAKMELQTGNHWSQLLKLACLTMNSTKKKSHGQTPFNTMWGRESKHVDLLSTYPNLAIDPIEDFEHEDAIFREILSQQSENDYIDDQDEFSPPCSEPGEELCCIYETRDTRFKSAAKDIHSEQLRQKLQYDKKSQYQGVFNKERQANQIEINDIPSKIVLKQNIERHTYMTPLHEELHKNLNVFHTYTCNTLLFEFLLDCKEYEIAMEYINLMLWQTFPENISTYIPLSDSSPIISVVNEEWLRDKYKFLGLVFISSIKRPQNLAGLSLSKYTPWETERIVGDGNCLFRCISKILTGDQTSHLEIRSTIAYFIASEGVTRIG